MRLSDIFKKSSGQTPSKPPEQSASPAVQPPPVPAPPEPVRPIGIPVPKAAAPAPAPSRPALRAEDVYAQAITEIKEIITATEKGNAFSGSLACMEGLVELTVQQNEDILMLADRATPDIYLYGHSVNVTIFSLLLGQTLGFDRARLASLGRCAFLHDIGMAKNLDLAQKKEKLTDEEYILVRRHPQQGQQMLRNLSEMTEEIKALIVQVMVLVSEKKGVAAPAPVKGDDIHEFARIIAVADVYEALTHPRAFRDRFIPHEALKMMIASAGHDFGSDMIKALIDRISLYPPGSYVRTNTDEIARIVGINRGLPTRPRIKVIADSSLQRVDGAKFIDLGTTPMIFIREAIDETKLNLPDKKLSLELKAIRWWVKGL